MPTVLQQYVSSYSCPIPELAVGDSELRTEPVTVPGDSTFPCLLEQRACLVTASGLHRRGTVDRLEAMHVRSAGEVLEAAQQTTWKLTDATPALDLSVFKSRKWLASTVCGRRISHADLLGTHGDVQSCRSGRRDEPIEPRCDCRWRASSAKANCACTTTSSSASPVTRPRPTSA